MATTTTINMPRDPNTLSNYNNWRTKHTIADLAISFEKQKLSGSVTLELESITDNESDEIILDSSYVDVQKITVDGAESKWEVKDRFEPYGSPVAIKVPGGRALGKMISVKIGVSTTKDCTALQWLTPAQTKGKYPYMVSFEALYEATQLTAL